MQELWVWSLGQEDPLEKEMATPSSILAWRIPWTEEPGRLQCMESQESDTTERLSASVQAGQLLWPVAAAWAATFLGLWGWRLHLHVLWAKQKGSMRAARSPSPFRSPFFLGTTALGCSDIGFSPCRFKEFHLFHITERKGDCDFFFCLVFYSLV